MIKELINEFRGWHQDWDIYDNNPQIVDKPMSVDKFEKYLIKKYPKLNF